MDDYYLLENNYLARRRIMKKKKTWVTDILAKRKEFGKYNHLHDDLQKDDKKFFDYYRMNVDTFNYILNAIGESIEKTSNFRETISPKERLKVTLRYLATGSSFKTMGYSFRISDVTVGRIVHETCGAIWNKLHDVHMQFPKNEEMEYISQSFWNKWRFPNCIGCLNGKHIRIRSPKHSGSMYKNYKQYFSIVLQAVAGPDYKFIAIDVGAYDKESDGGIFSHSNLCEKLENEGLGVQTHRSLPGTNIKVPHVLLRDEAYPLKTCLMRPSPISTLLPTEIIFNEPLSGARQVVECAFGILSAKWRLLQKSIEVNPESADILIKCICLLHNIIIDREGDGKVVCTSEQISNQTHSTRRLFGSIGENRSSSSAYHIKENFKTYFSSQELYNT